MVEQNKDILKSEDEPEIIIGLAGPVGTNFSEVSDIFKNELKRVNYEVEPVRISEILIDTDKSIKKERFIDRRYEGLMSAGTRFRKDSKDGRVLAFLASLKIQSLRHARTGDSDKPALRVAYVVRSFKHPDEVEALRKIYGKAFFLVGVNTSRELRKNILTKEIKKSRYGVDTAYAGSKAEKLIERDEEEVGSKLGQRLRDTFACSDVFINGENNDVATTEIRRFVELLFGNPFVTPTKNEYAMSLSYNMALRSSDLSRQVGAVLVDEEGSILAGGCNEVPKAGGGAYWPEESPDVRDFKLGKDPSHSTKVEMLKEIFFRLKNENWLDKSKKGTDIEELVDEALFGIDGDDNKGVLDGSKIMDLLEFGRVVHAEMQALSDATMRGVSTKNSLLYCTTFPCHNCARHIIASGIKTVFYIEPYPKSMTEELYGDSSTLSNEGGGSKVKFVPFTGISPNRFSELFLMTKRKDKKTGKALKWNPLLAKPKSEIYYWRMKMLEPTINEYLNNVLLPRIIKPKVVE